MKVSGFTIVKDAVKYNYPFKESILSILPTTLDDLGCIYEIITIDYGSSDNSYQILEELEQGVG